MQRASGVISVDPAIMHGEACFAGTRVPVQAFIDNLETGHTIDYFLEGFPAVTRQLAYSFLELATERLVECVSC